MGLIFGSNSITTLKLGSNQVNKVYLGSNIVWTSASKLDTPINLSIEDTILSFDPVENATSYEIFADGSSIGTYIAADFVTTSSGEILQDADGNNLTFTEA